MMRNYLLFMINIVPHLIDKGKGIFLLFIGAVKLMKNLNFPWEPFRVRLPVTKKLIKSLFDERRFQRNL